MCLPCITGMAAPAWFASRAKAGGRRAWGLWAGKVAIVTGAASRAEGPANGAATAIPFARAGARVVLVNRHADQSEAFAAHTRSEGSEALAFLADVTEPEAVEAMAAFAVAGFGHLDILHNNVGIGGRLSTPETIDLADRQRDFATNRTSALPCCRSCRREHPRRSPAGRHRQHADGQPAWRRTPWSGGGRRFRFRRKGPDGMSGMPPSTWPATRPGGSPA